MRDINGYLRKPCTRFSTILSCVLSLNLGSFPPIAMRRQFHSCACLSCDVKGVVEFSEAGIGDSFGGSAKEYRDVRLLHEAQPGETLWLRGRIDVARIKGGACFVVLRSDVHETVQCCSFKDNTRKDDNAYSSRYAEYLAFIQRIPKESLVEVRGIVVPARVKSCTQQQAEVHITELRVISRSAPVLPFNMNAAQDVGTGRVAEPEDDSDDPGLAGTEAPTEAGAQSDVVSQVGDVLRAQFLCDVCA
jgi:hypothetical protein